MGNEVCCLLPAPLMAVVTQSACTLCPLQTLPQPLVSNTLQVPSSFKQSPHDTFVIASCLIRDPFQKMAELYTWTSLSSAAHVQTQTNTDARIISVSLPAAWLIDCGCSDTLCRIGILPLIGADTNSSRTAGDRGKQRQHWQMTWMAGAARCGRNPTDVTLHSHRDAFTSFTLLFKDDNLQMCDICDVNHIWQSLQKNGWARRLRWVMSWTMRIWNNHGHQKSSMLHSHAAGSLDDLFPIVHADGLAARKTYKKNNKTFPAICGKLQQVKSLHASKVLHTNWKVPNVWFYICFLI